MTEESKTTGSETQETGVETSAPETQATQPEMKSIFEGFSADDKAYLDKKGWTEDNYVSQSFKAYRNLEKLMGGSKDIIELPKEGDAEAYNNILTRLGTPENKDGYSFDLGENPDNDSKNAVEAMKEIAIQSHMTKSQFNEFAKAFIAKDIEIGEAKAKAYADAQRQALNEYAAEKGKDFVDIKNRTDRALRMYGITDEDRLGIESGLGIKRFYDIFGTIGKNMEEGHLVTNANDTTTKTSESYKLELDRLFADRDFMNRYMQGDANALQKVVSLNSKIAGGR